MTIVLSSDDVPRRTRADYWQHVVGDNVAPMEMRYFDPAHFRSRMSVTELGPATLIDVDESRGTAWRTPRHIRRSTPDVFQLMVQDRGTAVTERNGRQFEVAPGDIRLNDPTSPFRIVHSEQHEVILSFPRSLLPMRPRDAKALIGTPIPGHRGAAALLSEFVRGLPGAVDQGDAVQRSRLGAIALDLLTVVLAAHTGRGTVSVATADNRTLLDRIDLFIEGHLHDPGLTPPAIAAAHHISLRQLHKLFETREETVRRSIRRRRLERCRQDLLDPAFAMRPVYAVGLRWGFVDAAHFNRSFRDEYRVTPGEFRRLAAGADGSSLPE